MDQNTRYPKIMVVKPRIYPESSVLFGVVVLGLVVVLLLFYYTAVHTPHLEVAAFQVYVYPEDT